MVVLALALLVLALATVYAANSLRLYMEVKRESRDDSSDYSGTD